MGERMIRRAVKKKRAAISNKASEVGAVEERVALVGRGDMEGNVVYYHYY